MNHLITINHVLTYIQINLKVHYGSYLNFCIKHISCRYKDMAFYIESTTVLFVSLFVWKRPSCNDEQTAGRAIRAVALATKKKGLVGGGASTTHNEIIMSWNRIKRDQEILLTCVILIYIYIYIYIHTHTHTHKVGSSHDVVD